MKRRLLLYGVVILGLAVVAGCQVNQTKEMDLYRDVLNGTSRSPAAEATAGEPLSLEQALHSANRNNEQLALRGEDYVQALIDKDRAFANFLPVVNLTPTMFQQQAVPAASRGLAKNHYFDTPVSGQMNLFNGLRDVAGYKRAAANISQSKALLLDMQSTLLLNVAQTYYQVLRSEESVTVLASSLSTQEEAVRYVKGRLLAGIARPLDVSQSEAQAAATRVLLVQARADVQNGRAVLAFLTSFPVGESALSDGFEAPEETPQVEQAMATAERDRQDLKAAYAATEAAKQNVQAAVGEYWPSLSLNANYFLHRESNPSDSAWNGLLSLYLPIFSAGRIHADVRTAWSQLRQANAAESLLRRQIIQEVRVALQNLSASRQRIQELQAELSAAEEGFRQADQSFRVGLATNLERLTAQDQLLSAQLQLASERYNLKVAYLDSQRILGVPGIQLSRPGKE